MYPPDVSRTQACRRFCLSSLLNGLKNLRGKGVFFEPSFRKKQLGSDADKFETVHVSAVSVDKCEPGVRHIGVPDN